MAQGADGGAGQPSFRRFGLGFQYRPPEAPVVMTFTSLAERRGEVRAEIHVEDASGGHVLRRYLNLLGSTSMKQLAGDLTGSSGGAAFPWPRILESAVESIIRALRVGPALETYQGELARPAGIRWLCRELVMADVPNVWIAAGSTGKSTFSSSLCLHHALGEPFLGRETTKGVPLYLDWESTSDDFEEKLWLVSRWLGHRGIPKIHRLRMGGPATQYAAAIANRVDTLGATLVVWDGMQAAGGPIGATTSYEAVAMELEALVGLLPPTTHLLLDHVTGDELKSGAVPLKGRGSSRKFEWARNQWTLVLDREDQQAGHHVVGWTHTKVNRDRLFPAFGVEVLHRPDELGFRLLDEREVEPLRERMPTWRQLLGLVQREGTMSNAQAAMRHFGKNDRKSVDIVRVTVNRYGKHFRRYSDGSFGPRDGAEKLNGAATGPGHPGQAPDNLPDQTDDSDEERDEELPW